MIVRKILSLVILLVFLGWVGWYIDRNATDFMVLDRILPADILSLAIAFLIIVTANGYFIFVVTAAFRIQLRSAEWLSLSMASSFANYFLPFRGGAGMRAIYLSRLHGLPLIEFVSTLSVMYLMQFVVNGVMALAGMAVIAADSGAADFTLLAFFVLVTLVGIVTISCNFAFRSHCRTFPRAQLAGLLNAVRRIRENRALVLRLWLLTAALAAASIWQCAVAFKAASVSISWGGILVYAASKNLGTLISLTPGSLGVVELISIYLGRVLDYDTADALVVQGLIRIVGIAILLVFGPLALLYLKRMVRRDRSGIELSGKSTR